MATLKVLMDNLYFSLACFAVGFVLLYAVLAAVGLRVSPGQNFWVIFTAWVGLSALTAAILTYRSLQKRKEASLIFTHRKR
jgi:hypothetical protein